MSKMRRRAVDSNQINQSIYIAQWHKKVSNALERRINVEQTRRIFR